MTSPIDPWTIINRTDSTLSTISSIMSPTTEAQPATETPVQPEPAKVVELTINAKPTTDNQAEEKSEDKDKEPEPPKERSRRLNRTNTQMTYSDSDTDTGPRVRRSTRHRRDYYSPIRVHNLNVPEIVNISSSSILLEKVNGYDGVADLPFPARGGVYLTTYPFSDRDVQKWSWALGSGVEESYISEPKKKRVNEDENDSDSDDDFVRGRNFPRVYQNDRRRIRSPGFDPLGNEMASVFLSRALDATVVPEDGEEKAKFVIIVQNKSKNGSSAESARLLVAETRKAAAMLMYYEVLNGTSITFVGAVPADAKLSPAKKKKVQFKRTETFEEAVKLYKEEGIVGVVC